jgi:hypothetical protein
MFAILHALGIFIADLFKSRSRLEAENVFLRHQLNVALRRELDPRASGLIGGFMPVLYRVDGMNADVAHVLAEGDRPNDP